MDKYRRYIHEREGISLLEHPFGFATYKKVSDDTYYIIDIYVDKEHRRNGIAKQLSSDIAKIAKADGATKLLGSVDISKNGVTQSLKAILNDGFEFSHAGGNGIYFVKNI